MRFKPCRLTVQDVRYQINAHGNVYTCGNATMTGHVYPVADDRAQAVRAEARRIRRSRASRARYAAMRSVGMTRTPCGWE